MLGELGGCSIERRPSLPDDLVLALGALDEPLDAAASGDPGSLVIATACPPVARRRSTTSTISGVAPDCETPTTSQPLASVCAP